MRDIHKNSKFHDFSTICWQILIFHDFSRLGILFFYFQWFSMIFHDWEPCWINAEPIKWMDWRYSIETILGYCVLSASVRLFSTRAQQARAIELDVV